MSDKVLFIMPVYNKEEFLDKAIQSVLNQTHTNISLCIIDDQSTDSSLSIANKYKEQDDRVSIYINEENSGCYRTRNRGLLENKNKDWDFFTIHDPDDTSDKDRISYSLRFFKDPNLLGLKTTFTKVNRKGEPQLRVGTNDIETNPSEGIAIFRRSVFDKIGYYDDTRFSGDTDYWWRLEYFCNANAPFTSASCLKSMYQALSHENNLTKIYDFKTDRPKYFQKSLNEIRSKMIPENNFYREAVT